MIDKAIIMPFNFFKYGGKYSGEHKGMKYMIEPVGEKPDFKLRASVWRGPYNMKVTKEEITSEEFDYSDDGRGAAIEWLLGAYEERKEYWDAAPSIYEVEPIEHI